MQGTRNPCRAATRGLDAVTTQKGGTTIPEFADPTGQQIYPIHNVKKPVFKGQPSDDDWLLNTRGWPGLQARRSCSLALFAFACRSLVLELFAFACRALVAGAFRFRGLLCKPLSLRTVRACRATRFLRKRGGGGAGRDRTDDLKLAKLALSQLSYGPGQGASENGGPE